MSHKTANVKLPDIFIIWNVYQTDTDIENKPTNKLWKAPNSYVDVKEEKYLHKGEYDESSGKMTDDGMCRGLMS